MHPIHWRIFSEHIALDRQQELERHRDLAEYIMAFHNYEGVKAVQEAREDELRFPQSQQDDIFFQQLQNMGIDLDKDKMERARTEQIQRDREREGSVPRAPTARQQIKQDIAKVHRKE